MIDSVRKYYHGEHRTALMAVWVGIMSISSSFTLVFFLPDSLSYQEMAKVLLIFGLFQMLAGIIYLFTVKFRTQQAVILYSDRSEIEIRRKEIKRMTKVIEGGYTAGFFIYTVLLLGGPILMLGSGSCAHTGTGLGLSIAGILGLCLEAFSLKKNRDYSKSLGSTSPVKIVGVLKH